MKVLVTGGAGFVGSHVAEYYAKMGGDVIAFDNLSRAEILGKKLGDPLYNWSFLKKNYGNINLEKGDVRDFEAVKKASEGAEVVIHTAAQVAVTVSVNDPRKDFEINAVGTFNVLEAARLNDAAVILCSTNKVYGDNVNKIPVKEDEKRYRFADERYNNGIPEDFPIDLCGHSPYGCSKLAADLYTQDYGHTYGIKTGVFRMSCIYGPRQFGVEDQGWVAWFAIATAMDKPITIYGDGKQVRDILNVDDLVRGFDAFLRGKPRHEVFNMGGGSLNTISLLELLDIIERTLGKRPRIRFADWRVGDQKVYVSDISKAREKLGWKPEVNLPKGIESLLLWVMGNKHLLNRESQ